MTPACSIRPWYVRNYLDHEFSGATLQRGKRYYAEERVLNLNTDANSIYATVKGSDDYSVCITQFDDDVISTECSCPTGDGCKHAVATLLAYAEQYRNVAPQDTSANETLRKETEKWTNMVQQAFAETQSPNAPTETTTPEPTGDGDVVAYVLREGWSYETGRTHIWSELQRASARRMKRGALSKPKAQYGLSDWTDVGALKKSGAEASDLAVAVYVATSMTLNPQGHQTLRLQGNAESVRLLLNTGRLMCADHHQAGPLKTGPARPGQLVWEQESDALRPRLWIAGQDLGVIPVDPLHYIDLKTMTCGPVDLSCPADLALAFLRSPPATRSTRPLVRGALRKASEQFDIPLPDGDGQPDLITIEPSPILKLSYREPAKRVRQVAEDSLHERYLYAELRFSYDGAEVLAEEEAMTLRPKGGGSKRYLRDAGFEQRAISMLQTHGFSEVPDWYQHDNWPARWMPDEATSRTFRDFSLEGIGALERAGWRVERQEDYPHQELVADNWYMDLAESAEGANWFDLELGVDIEGEQHSLLPLLLKALEETSLGELFADGGPTTLLLEVADGKFLRVPRERLSKLTDVLVELYKNRPLHDDRLRMSKFQMSQVVALEAQNEEGLTITGSKDLLSWGQKLASFDRVGEPYLPSGFTGELREYQRKGLAWLQFLSDFGLSGLLGDDMGLGKTLQVLAFIKAEQDRGPNKGKRFLPSIVVAPTSVVRNWAKEATRFFPDFKVFVHHGDTRLTDPEDAKGYDLVVTSYALLSRDEDVFAKRAFHAVVLDEAQTIKNPQTLAHRSACELNGRIRLALSGTPVENHLGELWSQFAFLLPGLLGNQADFRRQFRTPIETHGNPVQLDSLRNRVRPFILRRIKTEVESELPPKTEIIKTIELEGEQRDLYEAVRLTMDKRVRALMKDKGLTKSSIEILDALLKLRQVCCDPRLLPNDTAKGVTSSSKLDDLMRVLEKLGEEGRRVLVFSQFTSMLELIEGGLRERDMAYLKLTGATRKRQELIDSFQSGDVPIFLISLKAGGTGLNLTAADTVIHYDPWWNPAVENQATDRTHRIGQTHPVFVYKMICRDTVEEKIVELQKKKGALATSLLEGKGGLRGFTADDIQQLFAT